MSAASTRRIAARPDQGGTDRVRPGRSPVVKVPRRRTVVHYTDARATGGAERVALALLRGLDPGRWRPVLVVHDHAALAGLIREARGLDVAVHVVPAPGGPGGLSALLPLARVLRNLRPAVVHVHRSWARSGNVGVLAARLARVPAIVSTEHLYLESTPRRGRLVRRLVDVSVDRHIAVSEHIAAALRDRLRVSPSRISVVYNGIDARRMRVVTDPGLRATLRGDPAHSVVLLPARLERQKRQALLLEAIAGLPDVVAVLAGDGPDRSALERLAADLGIIDRVRFLGIRDDVPALMAAADAIALPSDAEGLPLVALEALAARKPLVATGIGGTREVVEDGVTGRLVPPGDAAALGEALREVLADPVQAARMAASGQEVVERRFSEQQMTRGVEAVYRAVLETQPAEVPGPAAPDEPEGGRSRRLRLVDWRFLAPGGPRFGDAFIDSVDREVVAALGLVAGRVQTGKPRSQACDLVVTDRRNAPLGPLIEALRPAGTLALVAGAVANPERATLEEAGLRRHRALVPWPTTGERQALLPVDDGRARRRFLLDRARGGGVGRIVLGWIRTVAFEGRMALGRAGPRIELWSKHDGAAGHAPASGHGRPDAGSGAGPEQPGTMWPSPDALVREHWPADSRPGAPLSLTWSLLTPGGRSVSKVVGLAGAPGRRPTVAVKWARTAEAAGALEREAAVLQDLPRLVPGVAGSVPRLLFAATGATGPVVGQAYLDGVRLARRMSPAALPQLASLTTTWLGGLVRSAVETGDGATGTDDPALELARIVDRFRALAGDAADPVLLEDALAATATLPALPVAVEHRDFAPWNLLIARRDRLLVLDWESAVPNGLPGLDAWYGLTYLALGCARLPERHLTAVYPDLVGLHSDSGRAVQRAFADYADRASLPGEVLPALRMLTWMVHLVSEARRIGQDQGRSAGPAGARSDRPRLATGTFLPLWTHEARAMLTGR
jgi:glycosyltransferase involved in cell wall biosynthesis/aminoglycoside phosphotransferase (APT) family kinase protein